ncbi:5-(carboxyamino)imidazole ribonucleotide synthase [Vallitalea okinawensis]|uniref:5-(carboxyamino)imidazole ribonucleotide synthase n=1 Tax=Vallitalea okinawensis TaxID=2078660 RepID=UPI001FA88690|nr:5-(carboxyamino)imidazole ribonucleotide synthase [Vallitalea okinawensis]
MKPCLTKQRLGIIGGGQLGKMMILDAKKLGIKVTILDPVMNCPAHSIADEHIVKSFDDEEAVKVLVETCDVVTYEFEHIAVDQLMLLEQKGYPIYPAPSILKTIQDKYVQKSFLSKKGFPISQFYSIDNINSIYEVAKKVGYPLMLKACTGGYDGKGNALIKDEDHVLEAYKQLGSGQIQLYAEEFVAFEKEISVIVCRSRNDESTVFPICENYHQDNILHETIVPAGISEAIEKEASKIAKAVIKAFDGIGIFCIEMFLTKGNQILINEIAPRPHNSGHFSIEGCYTSQFEQLVRAVLGLPLGDVSLIEPTVMVNLIGEEEGEACYEGLDQVLRMPKVNVHIYGKEEVKAGRKMGHITALGNTKEEARRKARQAKKQLRIFGGRT